MKQILIEANKLICNDGEVWLWKADNIEAVNFFATKEDAQKYVELRSQWRQEKGWKEELYSIGTKGDFMAAAKKHEADKKANEVKEYCKHADALIERSKLEIKALDGLIQVCRKFDGKVINKRFHDAVEKETGFYSSFDEYCFNMKCYDVYRYSDCKDYPNITIYVSWGNGYRRYIGNEKEVNPNEWQWNTGDRLEADKAVAVIEHYKNDRLATIESLKASKKKYAAYLRLARKAEQIFKDMQQYDYEIQEFARTHALSKYHCLSNLWLSY